MKDWFEENTNSMVRETVPSDFKDTDFGDDMRNDEFTNTAKVRLVGGETKNFCTPVFIDAGFMLDPTAALISAKQISFTLSRNVRLKLTIDVDHSFLIYYIQPGEHISEVTSVEFVAI